MAKRILNKVLPEHKETFEKYVHKWQILFGLQDWRFYVRYPGKGGNLGDTSIEIESRVATITLGTSFGDDPVNDFTLESLAVHELAHVWLAPLEAAFKSRNMGPEEQMAEEHRAVNLLEKLLMEKYYQVELFKEHKLVIGPRNMEESK